MKAPLFLAGIAALALTACGGGGSSGGGSYGGGGTTTPPTNSPSAPASQPQLGMATVNGSSTQVYQSTSNQHTLYTFGADTPNTSNCTTASGCTGIWPPYAAPAGTSATGLSSGFGLITRSDGSLQYTYQSAPLYMYSGDSASGTANGQGITSFGGTWGASRPQTSTPGPSSPPSGCIGYYC